MILSSDNGPVVDDGYDDGAKELLSGHSPTGNLRGGKYSAFEGGARIPMIVRWPGKVAEGEQSDALISQVDWMQSLASLIDARMPLGSAPDSRQQLDALIGADKAVAPWVSRGLQQSIDLPHRRLDLYDHRGRQLSQGALR